MIKLKQYINNNKQLLIIFLGMFGFLFLHNTAYCDLSFFQKWYQNTENYFLNLTWQKAISDPIEITKSLGWVSIGAIGSLYAFEWIWNIRLLASKALYDFTPLGVLDDIGGKGASWFLFRNTSGPLKYVIDNVPYEEILPLYLARKHAFPYLFIQPKPNIKIEIREVEKIVTQTVEKEVVRFKDRSQLKYLHNKLDKIERSVFFINDNSDFHNKITQEMQNLTALSNQSIHEETTFVAKGQDFPEYLTDILKIEIKHVNVTPPLRPTPGTFYRVLRNPDTLLSHIYGGSYVPGKYETRLYGKYNEHTAVQLNVDVFKEKYPKIYLLLTSKLSTIMQTYPNSSVTLNIGYQKVGRGIISGSKIDPALFTLEYPEGGSLITAPINPEIETFYDTSLRDEKTLLQELTAEVRGFIYSNTNSEIDDYLVDRLQTETLINKSKDLIDIEEYIRKKREMASTFREVQQPVSIEEEKTSESENTAVTTETQTDILAPLSVGSLGVVATLTQLPLDQIFVALNHILGIAEFQPLLNNPETVYALTQLYENNGLQVPEILQNYTQTSSTVLPEPTNIIAIKSGTIESIKPYIIPTISVIGLGILTLGSAYIVWKYTGDSSVFVQQKEVLDNSLSTVLGKMID